MQGIYLIEVTRVGKTPLRYIGRSENIERRRTVGHRNSLRRGDHHNNHLQRAYDKYGEEAVIFTELCQMDDASEEEVREAETRFIWAYRFAASFSAEELEGAGWPPDAFECCNRADGSGGSSLVARELPGHQDAMYSRYKGVTFDKTRGKWVALIKHKGTQYGKRFDTELEAAQWRDAKADELYGVGVGYRNLAT